MRWLLVFCSMVLSLSCAGIESNAAQISEIRLTDYGILRLDMEKAAEAPVTAPGGQNVIRNAVFTEKTTSIPARKGSTFGIQYSVHGNPEGQTVELTYMVLHPPIKGQTSSSAKVKAAIGSQRADFYTFEEEYELVEGAWKMQIHQNDKLLLEQTFFVYK